MYQRVLRAVAMPKMLFWAPFVPAMINFAVWTIVFVLISVLDLVVNPLWLVFGIGGCHLAIASLGLKEPHLSTLLPAFGMSLTWTKNLIKSRGNKYVP